MNKSTLKNVILFVSLTLTVTLLIDHVHYTIKTGNLSEYTLKSIASENNGETNIEILQSVGTKYMQIFLVSAQQGQNTKLYLRVYRMSPLSHAYQLEKQIITVQEPDTPSNKSFIVDQGGRKMIVLYGGNSNYNIQVIRDRVVSEYLDAKSSKYYLYLLEDIEHLYFYYESVNSN